MNWIKIIDLKQQLGDIMVKGKSILAQNQYGNIGYVYWNSYEWVYDVPGMDDEIKFPGSPVRYIELA